MLQNEVCLDLGKQAVDHAHDRRLPLRRFLLQDFDGLGQHQLAVHALCYSEAYLPGSGIQLVEMFEHPALAVFHPVVAEVAKHDGLGSRGNDRHICRRLDRTVEDGIRYSAVMEGSHRYWPLLSLSFLMALTSESFMMKTAFLR